MTFCDEGQCQCLPDCDGMECGDDGCGDSCGSCGQGVSCVDGECQCQPDCTDMKCGDDGCGGDCGECPENRPYCVANLCVKECTPACQQAECGPDGCGSTCGDCEAGFECVQAVCQESACGICPEDTTCGYLDEYPEWCAGEDCADDLTYEGECGGDGNTLIWCDEGLTIAIDCDYYDPETGCDWAEEAGYYDCM